MRRVSVVSAIAFLVSSILFAGAAEASAPKLRAELNWLVAAHQEAASRHGLGQFLVQRVEPALAVSNLAEPVRPLAAADPAVGQRVASLTIAMRANRSEFFGR